MVEKNRMGMAYNVLTLGLHDAVKNGELHCNIPTRLIFVASQSERNALPNIEPGTFVATYGLSNVWQYSASGDWMTIK